MGRGSATANKFTMNMVLPLLLLCFLLGTQVVESATYTVGDKGGWGFNSGSWTKGKRFKAGDVLVFNYNPSIHNVVLVNAAGYNSCKTPRGAKVLTSGSDRITVAKGTNYFICNFSGHCESGMKITVTAA